VVQAKWVEQREGAGKIESSMAKAMGGLLARRVTQTFDVLGASGLSAAGPRRSGSATPASSTSMKGPAKSSG
jgi:hypothetical protein